VFNLKKRPLTPAYILFFILFSPDTWRIIAGIVFSWLLTPRIAPPNLGVLGIGMIYVMLACIGYSVFSWPARQISRLLQKWILKNK